MLPEKWKLGITEILRRIWLFSANKIKSSEYFSKELTQLIVELNSSLQHIIATLGFSLKNQCQISYLKITCFLVQEQVFDQFHQGRIFTRIYKINWIDFDLQSNFDWMNEKWMLKTNIELTTYFHEFSEYESAHFFTIISHLKNNLFVSCDIKEPKPRIHHRELMVFVLRHEQVKRKQISFFTVMGIWENPNMYHIIFGKFFLLNRICENSWKHVVSLTYRR